MSLGFFIPIMFILVIAVYVGSFQDEFDKENLSSVWIIVGIIGLLLLLNAILASIGSSI